MLVGVAAIVGAYEDTYTNAPSQFLHESPTAATNVLLAAAFGYLATAFLGASVSANREHETAAHDRDRELTHAHDDLVSEKNL